MKKNLPALLILTCLCVAATARGGDIWQRVRSGKMPSAKVADNKSEYLLYTADEQQLKASLATDMSGAAEQTIDLPMANGSMKTFRVWSTPLLPAALSAKYPQLSTYTGVAIDDAGITVKLDFTAYGFHAMVMDGKDISFIDPAGDERSGYYTTHYKSHELRSAEQRMACKMPGDKTMHPQAGNTARKTTAIERVSNGYELRKYRLALSCDHQYAQAVAGAAIPTKELVLSKMTTTMNRVNGVYERELAVTMVFVADEDKLIFLTEAGDPFGANNDDAGALLGNNQVICDSFIGNANYDLGHIFTTGAGGLSQLGVVCNSTLKAQSVTGSSKPTGDGFDIDYVAHEMGHEFGSQHTFNNNNDSSCKYNAVEGCAFEPGSGSTIMCYAGICSPDNLQPHSDAYFSGSSLEQIQGYITTGGDGCAVKTLTGNKLVNLPHFNAHYTIPYLTPFELTAPAVTDSVADTLTTYCWEQWDLGGFGSNLANTHAAGPIFRSYPPVKAPVRPFPNISMVFADSLSNAGTDNASGEKVPDVARQLTFRLTMRNIMGGNGCFLMSEDSVLLDAVNTGTGFKVTSHNTDGKVLQGNSADVVNWDIAHTTEAPISCPNVDIFISADSGKTWPYFVGTFPNTGTAAIIIPNPDTVLKAARFKVKGTGNVFFNVNSKYFRVEPNLESALKIYPVPAHDVLHITYTGTLPLEIAVYNSIGSTVWRSAITGNTDLPAYLWGRGVYIMKMVDTEKRSVIKKIVVD